MLFFCQFLFCHLAIPIGFFVTFFYRFLSPCQLFFSFFVTLHSLSSFFCHLAVPIGVVGVAEAAVSLRGIQTGGPRPAGGGQAGGVAHRAVGTPEPWGNKEIVYRPAGGGQAGGVAHRAVGTPEPWGNKEIVYRPAGGGQAGGVAHRAVGAAEPWGVNILVSLVVNK